MSQARGRAARAGDRQRRVGGDPYPRAVGATAVSGRGPSFCLCPPRVAGPLAAAIERKEPERSCPRRSAGAARRPGGRDSPLRSRRLQERQKGPGGLEGKSFLLSSRQIPTTPHALSKEEAGWELGTAGWGGGRGGLPRASPHGRDPGWSQSRRLPPPVGTPPALLPSLSQPASSWRVPTRSAPPLPRAPPKAQRVTRPQSYTSGSGFTEDKTCLGGQNTRFQELFSGLEGQRVETDTPTRGARLCLRCSRRSQSRGPSPASPLEQ